MTEKHLRTKRSFAGQPAVGPASRRRLLRWLAELGRDFYGVFAGVKCGDILPGTAWDDFAELSAFLKDSGVDRLKRKPQKD